MHEDIVLALLVPLDESVLVANGEPFDSALAALLQHLLLLLLFGVLRQSFLVHLLTFFPSQTRLARALLRVGTGLKYRKIYLVFFLQKQG